MAARTSDLDQARIAYAAGRLEDARRACEACLRADGPRPDALNLLAQSYAAERRFAEAAVWFSRSAAADPDNAETLGNLGAALLAAGRPHEAIAPLERALRMSPANPLPHHHLGRAQELLGDEAAALESQMKAIAADPTFSPAYRELGFLLEKAGRLGEALNAFDSALRLRADDGATHYNRGVVLLGLRRFEEAGAAFGRALELGRETASTYNNLGLTFHRRGCLADAATHFRRALQLDGRLGSAWLNLGNVLQDQGDVAAAIEHYSRALHVDPADPTTRINLALAYLISGDFARGWPLFDARLLLPARQSAMHIPPAMPLWDGLASAPTQRDLILVTEQGFGDAIQFVRFGAILAEKGLRPVLQCHPRLRRLLASAQGFVETVPDGTEYEPGRYAWFPLMSVSGALGTELNSIPATSPYLTAEPARVDEWRARLNEAQPEGDRCRIGIAWQGNLEHEQESLRGRSIPLANFRELVEIPGTTWVSLQKGLGSEQLAQVPWGDRVERYDRLDCGPDAFLDTAAIMMSLDLVITSDTSIAHLAGALGRPTWVALARMPDWRWLLDRADSPWYPSMRLFRQPRPGDWQAVFGEMKAHLGARLNGLVR